MSRSDKAAEREKDNPLCEECFTYPTNHFCGFVLSSGDKCSKPVCGICCEQKPTRCTSHYWIERSPPKPVERHSATLAPKNRKIVTKKVLKTCSECQNNSTPSVCVDCQVPVCTTCKLILNGSLGSYACSKHAKKLEVTFTSRPSNLQGQPIEKPPPRARSTRSTGTTFSDTSNAAIDSSEANNNAIDSSKASNNNTTTATSEANNNNILPRATSEATNNTSNPPIANARKRKSTRAEKKEKSNPLVAFEVDSMLHKTVSYDISSDIGKQICENLNCTISSLSNNCIVGTVTRKVSSRVISGRVIYEVAWNNSSYGTMELSHSVISAGIENYLAQQHETQQSQLSQQVEVLREQRTRRSDPFDHRDIIALIENSRNEDPELSPCSSGSESDGTEESESYVSSFFFGENHIDRAKSTEPYAQDNEYLLISDDESGTNDLQATNVDALDGLDWDPKGNLDPRPEKMLPKRSTTKPQFIKNFDTPLSSFYSFLPQAIWEKIRFESNRYARQKMLQTGKRTVSGHTWYKDISLQEMYQFFGLLIHMTVLPTPGRDYTYYWKNFHVYPWVDCMRLYRFKQIRSVLHFNTSTSQGKSKDPLHTVRPIYASVQQILGRYLDLGSEFSLDEASAACRSSFGRHLIVYNPTKNCGKFHFRFYMLCCSVTYVCIKMRIHVKTDEMVEEDAFQGASEDGMANASTKVLNKLILDMASPLYNKGITINFNNYYASPSIAIELLKHQVYCRGTLRKNKRLIPPYILFKKSEARNKESRGATKIAVNKRYGLVAVGWIDGNPVHMISSADTEQLTTVQRNIGGKKQAVQAPEVVLRYNKGMDGVDRHDQYRALFSLCKTHGFKKYPVKLVLALFDIALTNAVLHFQLRWKNSDCPNSKMSCADFLQSIANSLISANREWELEEDPGVNAIVGSTNVFSPECNPAISQMLNRNVPDSVAVNLSAMREGCVYEALEKYNKILKKNSKKCQICEYERRGCGRYKNVMICLTHGVRACGYARPPRASDGNERLITNAKTKEVITDFTWICGDASGLTCMEKFHLFYLPKHLFKPTSGITRPTENQDMQTKLRFARIVPNSELYRARQAALGIDAKERPKKYKARTTTNSNSSSSDSDDPVDKTNNNNNKRKESRPPIQVIKRRTREVRKNNNNKASNTETNYDQSSGEESPQPSLSMRRGKRDKAKKIIEEMDDDSNAQSEFEDDEQSDATWATYNRETV